MIIPVKDRPDDLERALASLVAQSRLPFEIIVVDQSADDRCRQVFEHASLNAPPEIRFRYAHDTSLSGANAARNAGIALSGGEIVAFSDDDAQLEVGGIAEFQRVFSTHPEVVAVGGVVTNYNPPGPLGRIFTRAFYRGPFFDERQPVYCNWRTLTPDVLIPTGKLNGGMMAFRREYLKAVGGLDDQRLCGACVGDDIDVAQRMLRHTGKSNSVVLAPRVQIVHESLGSWRREDRSIEFQIVSQHYLLTKNLGDSALHHVQYWWMVFGLFVRAAIASLRRRRLQSLRSFARGVKCIRNDYRDCPFIRPAPSASSIGRSGAP